MVFVVAVLTIAESVTATKMQYVKRGFNVRSQKISDKKF